MAKLTNVQTLDMVNGEITKVAYDGAEYALVDKGAAGDIGLVINGWGGQKEGEFFEVKRVYVGFRDVTYTEVDGNSCKNANCYVNDMKYFRKISADKTTLEERVTAIESDVATLKGERVEAESNRLTVGDVAKVVGDTSLAKAEIGDVVKIVVDAHDRQPYRCERISDGKDVGWFFPRDLEAYTGEQSTEAIEFEGVKYRKVDRYANEGDVVVFSATPKFNGQGLYITVGKAYKVSDGDGYDDAQFYADDNDHIRVYGGIVNRSKENVAVYEKVEAEYKPKLKAGDFVKFKRSISDTQAGKPYLIEYYTEEGKLAFKDDAGDWCNIARTGDYEILSAEEVAKHRESEKWAKIGRKVGEFKKGDVVRVLRDRPFGSARKQGEIGVITTYDTNGSFCVGESCGWMGANDVELVAPVESKF